jgi:hypothetical protein
LVVLSPDRRAHAAEPGHVDLLEWADVAGVPFPFPMPAATTSALWDEICRVPRNPLGEVSIHERVAHVVRKAAQAFERALRERQGPEAFAIDFGVHLDTGREAAWRMLRLACRSTANGEFALVLGFPDELPPSPPPDA